MKQVYKTTLLQTCATLQEKGELILRAKAMSPDGGALGGEGRTVSHRGLLLGLKTYWNFPHWILKLLGTEDSFLPSISPFWNGNHSNCCTMRVPLLYFWHGKLVF